MDYKQKFLKYKNKYLLLKNQLGGKYKTIENTLNSKHCKEDKNGEFETEELCNNHNSWRDPYIELYNFLLDIVDEIIKQEKEIIKQKKEIITPEVIKKIETKIITLGVIQKIDSLCQLLLTRLEQIYSRLTKEQRRKIDYDIEFIINIISMLFNKFTSSIKNIKEFNNKKNLDSKTFYYIEDCYTDDIELFFKEYDNLVETKKSEFFFRSNLVNLSKLVRCYADKCIENITDIDGFYFDLKKQITPEQFVVIFNNFSLIKKDLIKLLLESYKDFDYEKIKQFYIKYLEFYYNNFQMLYLVLYDLSELENISKETESIIKDSGDKYYIYLSCNLASEHKFYRFELTRCITSFIGFRQNNDGFDSSLEIVYHDIKFHKQYNRKLSYTDKELLDLRDMFIELYKYFKDDKILLEKIIKMIHISNYENNNDTKLNINKIIEQIINKMSIGNFEIIKIINFGIKEYRKLNPNNTDLNILVDDSNFNFRLQMNDFFYHWRLSNLTFKEKSTLVNTLKNIFPAYSFIIIQYFINTNKKKEFIIDKKLFINPDKPLTSEVISLYQFIINKKICLEEFNQLFGLVQFFLYYGPTKNNRDLNILNINLSKLRANIE